MLFMFEYGNTKLLIIEQFPNIVDFDVMSLNPCRDALETETVINEVGIKAAGIRIGIKVRNGYENEGIQEHVMVFLSVERDKVVGKAARFRLERSDVVKRIMLR